MATDIHNRELISWSHNRTNGHKLIEVLCSGCWNKFTSIFVPNDVSIEYIRLLCHKCSELEKTAIPV